MDEVQHTKVDSEEALNKDVLSEGEINVPTRGDFEATPCSPHVQPVPTQI